MPEGDTVHLAAARLDRALAGQVLTKSDLRVPRFATSDLSGRVVNEVVARGKHLLFRIDDGVTLHTHFKMEGSWHVYRRGEKWRGPAFQARAVLETKDRVAVGFRLGVCELLPTNDEHRVVGISDPTFSVRTGMSTRRCGAWLNSPTTPSAKWSSIRV